MERDHTNHTRKRFRQHVCLSKFAVILGLVLAAVIGINSMFGIAVVQGSSMEPALSDGELILYRRIANHLDYGDIVILESKEKQIVKRIAARPLDNVEISGNGELLVNGGPSKLTDIYILGKTQPGDMTYPVTLGTEEYFVMGDNRPVSKDSRYKEIGVISKKEILGILIFSFHIY